MTRTVGRKVFGDTARPAAEAITIVSIALLELLIENAGQHNTRS